MSHLATITVNLDDLQIEELQKLCDDKIKSLNQVILNNKHKNIQKIIEQGIYQLELIKQGIKNQETSAVSRYELNQNEESTIKKRSEEFFQKQYDSIQKLSMNVINSIDFIADDIPKTIVDFEKYLFEYGSIAIKAKEILSQEKIELNDENLGNKIDEIVKLKATPEEMSDFKTLYYSKLNKLPSESLKNYFMQKILLVQTKRDIDDFKLFYDSKLRSIYNAEKAIEPFLKYLHENESYKVTSREMTTQKDSITIMYKLVNNLEEDIEIAVTTEGQIQYQIGDYVQHICTKTADQMIEYVQSKSKVKVIKHNILRTFNPTPPKYKAKEKIKKWGK